MIINLHIHSKVSDGEYDLEKVISMCKQNQYSIISITDHNTLCQQEEAQKLCEIYEIKYIFGVEISAIYNGKEIHLLVYFKVLPPNGMSEHLRKWNIQRAVFLKRMQSDSQRNRNLTNIEDIINTVHQYKGFVILAHPIEYKDILDALIEKVDGLELIYPGHDLAFISYLCNTYKDSKLYFTAGTDFHNGLMDNEPYKALVAHYRYLFESFILNIIM